VCNIKLTRFESLTDILPIFRLVNFQNSFLPRSETSLLELPREHKLLGACSDCSGFGHRIVLEVHMDVSEERILPIFSVYPEDENDMLF